MDNNNLDNMGFPPRNKLTVSKPKKELSLVDMDYDFLTEQVKNLNLEETDFENAEYDTVDTKIDKQKVYFWIRVFLKEEAIIEPGDDITIKYTFSGEELITKFICFAKVGGNTVDYINGEPVVTNYNTEDDPKVLCLMVDEEKINNDSQDIPFLRRLFRIGRHYEYELLKRTDLLLTNGNTGEILDYYDIEF